MIRSFLALLTASIGLSAIMAAHADPVDGGHARVELVSERETATPGETLWLGLSFEMDPNWHIYWLNAGDAGIPPSIRWTEDTSLEPSAFGDFRWPLPELIPVVEDEIMDYGYSGTVVLPFPVTIPAGADDAVRLSAEVNYLICEEICIPETVELELFVDVGETQVPDRANAGRIAAALADVPPPFEGQANLTNKGERWVLSATGGALAGLTGEARFFPETHDIVHAAAQPATFGPSGLSLELVPDSDTAPETLRGILRVHPEEGDPVAVNIVAGQGDVLGGTSGVSASGGSSPGAGEQERNATGLAGPGGIVFLMSMALLGGLILNLMPCVLPVLSIKAIGMVHAAASGERGVLREHGLLYTAGVLVCFGATALVFLSLRAAGQFVSLGFQLQYPAVVAVLALVMVLIGLWLLGVFSIGSSIQGVGSGLAARGGRFGAFFTGILAAVVGAPCVGPFVGVALGAVLDDPWPVVVAVFLALGLGLALPFLVLSFVPGLHRSLPRPGPWMERLKQAFAFPMFLTAAWLITVLGTHPAASATAFGAIILAAGVWLFGLAGGRFRPLLLAAGAALALTGIVWPVSAGLREPPEKAGTSSDLAASPEEWSPEKVAELTAEGRGVFVDFTASWCATCQVNKRTTLTRASVLEAMADANVSFLVADFTRPDDAIAAELKKYGSPGVPMYLLYAPGASEPEVLPVLLSPDLLKRRLAAF